MSKSNGPQRKILYEKPNKQNKPIMPYLRLEEQQKKKNT